MSRFFERLSGNECVRYFLEPIPLFRRSRRTAAPVWSSCKPAPTASPRSFHALRKTLEGQAHQAAPEVMAPVLIEFFTGS
ncbi:MAG TPA: hypothetical protein VF618_16920 [Thermoanaerobaculia bacterium]